MKILFHICLTALSILLLPSLAMGDTPPQGRQFLYIASFAPPEEILGPGSDPHGANLNLLDHYTRTYASGAGFLTPPLGSGFLDVYGDEHSAVSALAGRAYMAHMRSTYPASSIFVGNVYRIRADENFYSASTSLQNLLQRMRATNDYPLAIFTVEYLEGSARMANQFVTDLPISGHMIDSYIRFTVDYRNFGLSTIALGPMRAYSDHYHAPLNPDARASINPYHIALPSTDRPLLPPPPRLPPIAGPGSSDSSSDLSFSGSESEAGSDHDGDIFVADPGGLVAGLLSFDGRICLPPGSHIMKRSADSTPCSALPVINLSRRSRVLRILLAEGSLWSGSSSGANGHDEL